MIWPLSPRRALPVDDATWRCVLEALPWLDRLDADAETRLRGLVADFLSRKTISGAHGLEPDDRMRLVIAAQACLPILRLGLEAFDDFVEVVVHPAAFEVHRRVIDDDGLVHEFDDVLSGEAMDGGPVVLSWDDIAGADRDPGANVVIHEFAHKLDMADGVADGCPPMPESRRGAWLETLGRAYDEFVARLEAVEDAIPGDVDPESPEADAWYATLHLDPYAATDEAEFFAVAAEVFFTDPGALRDGFPELHAAFADYFGVRKSPLPSTPTAHDADSFGASSRRTEGARDRCAEVPSGKAPEGPTISRR